MTKINAQESRLSGRLTGKIVVHTGPHVTVGESRHASKCIDAPLKIVKALLKLRRLRQLSDLCVGPSLAFGYARRPEDYTNIIVVGCS